MLKLNEVEEQNISQLPGWYNEFLKKYLEEWQDKVEDTDKLIAFLEKYKKHEKFKDCLIHFKKNFFDGTLHHYTKVKTRLFLDFEYVSFTPEFNRLKEFVNSLIQEQNDHQTYFSMFLYMVQTAGKFIIEHPYITIGMGLAVCGIIQVAAASQSSDKTSELDCSLDSSCLGVNGNSCDLKRAQTGLNLFARNNTRCTKDKDWEALLSIKIETDPQTLTYIKLDSFAAKHTNRIEQTTELVKKNLMKVTRLQEETIRQPDLKIHISLSELMELADGRFIPESNTIFISTGLHPKTLENTLKNEFHHAQLFMQNNKKGCRLIKQEKEMPGLYKTSPYCNKKGLYSVEKINEFEEAVVEDLENIELLLACVKKLVKNEKLNSMEKNFYNQLVLALEDFNPLQIDIIYTLDEYTKQIKPSLRANKDQRIPFTHYATKNFSGYYFDKVFYNIVKIEKGKVYLHIQYGCDTDHIEKAKALLMMFKKHIYNIIGDKNNLYSSYKPSEKMMELASYLEEYPKGIQKLFLPNFCEYFSNYFGLNYCEEAGDDQACSFTPSS